MSTKHTGRYQIEAAIAALHSAAPSADATDWTQIDALYQSLLRYVPTPVVALNGAVARAMARDPESGLAMIDEMIDLDEMDRWYLLHSTRAELLRRAGRVDDARAEFSRAVVLAPSETERNFLSNRLAALD